MSSRIPLEAARALRLGRPPEIWFKPALSVVAAVAPPNLTLVVLDRLDLAMYTMAGSVKDTALDDEIRVVLGEVAQTLSRLHRVTG
ncbi:hypothetical protein AB0P20_35295, partial [Streptomyces nigra]